MTKHFKAVCAYEDGTQDEATISITSEGSTLFQVAWQISNGETGREVVEADSMEEVLQNWCEEYGFEQV
jgi:hypothetical protein